MPGTVCKGALVVEYVDNCYLMDICF